MVDPQKNLISIFITKKFYSRRLDLKNLRRFVAVISMTWTLFFTQGVLANSFKCSDMLIEKANLPMETSRKIRPIPGIDRTAEEYEKVFGIPPFRNTNTSQYVNKYGPQMKQIHQQFMKDSSENVLGISMIFGRNKADVDARWTPHLKKILNSKS